VPTTTIRTPSPLVDTTQFDFGARNEAEAVTQPETPTEPARRRADAQRNRERILAAARAAFTDPDADVSMAEIARQAGIGSATLYRNFADRRMLLEALYAEEIAVICRAAATGEGGSAGSRLTTWLRRFYAYFTSKRVLAAELLEHTDADSPVFIIGFARIVDAASPLADAAHESGELRNDLSLEQVLALIASIANIPGDSTYRQPILDAALDALRPGQ
jgi:AcrR family transcriptional regulator